MLNELLSNRRREAVAMLEPLAVDARGVGELLGVSRATVFAMHSGGRLPMPVRITPRAPRWLVSELRDWLVSGCPNRQVWEKMKAAKR